MRVLPGLATLVAVLLISPSDVLAGVKFSHSCLNYYLGNGISDATGELFVEAWCHGGIDPNGLELPSHCSRLKLSQCFKNVNGQLRALNEDEEPSNELLASCDIESCAIRGDAWDGPVMTCYCQNAQGDWKLASIDLNQHIGNNGGYLSCGHSQGAEDCLNPWAPASDPQTGELR